MYFTILFMTQICFWIESWSYCHLALVSSININVIRKKSGNKVGGSASNSFTIIISSCVFHFSNIFQSNTDFEPNSDIKLAANFRSTLHSGRSSALAI